MKEEKYEPLKFFNVEPKSNLRPLPTEQIQHQKQPTPILFIKVPVKDSNDFELIVEKLEFDLKREGWYLLWSITNELEYSIQMFSPNDELMVDLDADKIKKMINKRHND